MFFHVILAPHFSAIDTHNIMFTHFLIVAGAVIFVFLPVVLINFLDHLRVKHIVKQLRELRDDDKFP